MYWAFRISSFIRTPLTPKYHTISMGLKVTRMIKQGVGEPIYTEHSGALLHWDTIGVVMFIVFIIFWSRQKEGNQWDVPF